MTDDRLLESGRLVERLEAVEQSARVAGSAALVVAAVGGLLLGFEPFFEAWLLGFVFWIGLPLGALGFVALHHMVGGAWGFVIRRILESAAGTLPVMAVLFLPLVLGLGTLYPWARPDEVAGDPLLLHKQPYLNVPFFLARTAVYFALWIGIAHLLNRWSSAQDGDDDPSITRRLQLVSGAALPLYGLTVTFASIDWAMSLEPHWFSTIYGMLFVAGQGLTVLAFATLALQGLRGYRPLRGVVEATHFHDLGNLTLAFVMLWGYMSFSQYLIIWSGNLPEEITWYLHRGAGGWEYFVPGLLGLHFAVPFLVLLSRRAKRSGEFLARVAVGILVVRLLDVFWLVKPAFSPGEFSFHWMDGVVTFGIGALWLAAFTRRLRDRPLLPLGDPRLAEALARDAAAHDELAPPSSDAGSAAAPEGGAA